MKNIINKIPPIRLGAKSDQNFDHVSSFTIIFVELFFSLNQRSTNQSFGGRLTLSIFTTSITFPQITSCLESFLLAYILFQSIEISL
ncbi:TPA: hypothetical protein DCZ31_01510 [Patescibacteria group bacterium]|nr:hypothetical protein [Candidatus Gracilibacteria bacterium]